MRNLGHLHDDALKCLHQASEIMTRSNVSIKHLMRSISDQCEEFFTSRCLASNFVLCISAWCSACAFSMARVIFSRLEFRWLAPHPPLALLEPEVLWVPSGQNVNGVNDRHAVMHRMHAPTYFGRWELLLSDQLLKARPPWPPRPWPPTALRAAG